MPDYYRREVSNAKGQKIVIEVWDIIRAWDLSAPSAFALKYLLRAGKKAEETELKDINKAIDCLRRERLEIASRRLEKEGERK